MGSITRTIVGDKEGIREMLAEHRDYQEGLRNNTHATRRDKDRASGVIEGLRFADSLIADWDIEASYPPHRQ